MLTARDLGRQIPAEWQERVKHRARRDFAAYLEHTRRTHGRTKLTPFWRVQDVPRILDHVGCRAPSRARARRHGRRTGLAAGAALGAVRRGAARAAAGDVRRRARRPTPPWAAPRWRCCAGSTPPWPSSRCRATPTSTGSASWSSRGARRAGRDPAGPSCPRRARPWVDEIAAAWIGQIEAMGVDVVGDLAELRTVWPADGEPWADPDAVDPDAVADAAIDALAHVLDRIGSPDRRAARRPRPVRSPGSPAGGAADGRLRRGRRGLDRAPARGRYDDRGRTGAPAGRRPRRRSSAVETSSASSCPLPSATHLELVRRINQQAGGTAVPGLVDLVLTTAPPGRGRVDVPLSWPEAPTPRASAPRRSSPTRCPATSWSGSPSACSPGSCPTVPAPPPAPDLTRWPVPWRRRFRLYGSPGTVAGVRSALLGQGLVESDWRPVHLVLGRPLEAMMAEHWAATTAQGAHLRWTTLWRRAEATKALPPRLDVVGTAERLAARRGSREPVHLVVAREADEVAARRRRRPAGAALRPRAAAATPRAPTCCAG